MGQRRRPQCTGESSERPDGRATERDSEMRGLSYVCCGALLVNVALYWPISKWAALAWLVAALWMLKRGRSQQ